MMLELAIYLFRVSAFRTKLPSLSFKTILSIKDLVYTVSILIFTDFQSLKSDYQKANFIVDNDKGANKSCTAPNGKIYKRFR